MAVDRKTVVPALIRPTISNTRDLQKFIDAVYSTVMTREGRLGSSLDRNITVRDLWESGLAQILIDGEYSSYGGDNGTGITAPPSSSDGTAPDLSVPPAPTGISAAAGIGTVFLSWTDPTTLYSNHAYTEVWRSSTNDIGTAVLIGTSLARFYPDLHGANGATRYYWIRFVSSADVTGPYNATSGTSATTPTSPGWILSELTGAITTSQLYSTLNDRINLIDAASGVAGSVNARVLQEANDRAVAVAAEALARGADIDTLTTTMETADSSLALSISLLTASTSGSFDPLVIWYYDTTAESWTSSGATQSWNAGWIEQDATGSDPQLTSPSGLSILGSQYNVVMARIKRLAGTEASWDGTVTYVTSGGGGHSFSASYKKTVSVPSPFAIGDIAVVEWDMSDLTAGGTDWVDSTITQIRLELGADTTDTIAIDWIGVGRKAPGASTAGLLTEIEARTDAINAQITARETLASQITGFNDPTGKVLTDLTTGLLFSEREARSDADGSEVTARQTLSTKVLGNVDPTGLTLETLSSGLIYDERTARSTDDSSEVTARQSLATKVLGTVNPSGLTLETLTAGLIYDERTARSDAVGSVASDVTLLEADLAIGGATYTAIADAQSTALTAYTTAQGKIVTFAQASPPTVHADGTPLVEGDTWVDTDDSKNELYMYISGSWQYVGDARIASTASDVSTLAARVDNVDGPGSGITLEQKAVVTANAIDGISGSYTVKLDANGAVAGFGLSLTGGTPSAAGTPGPLSSLFYVSSDAFAVGPPAPKWRTTNDPTLVLPDYITTGAGNWKYVRPSTGTSKYIYVATVAGNRGAVEPTWPVPSEGVPHPTVVDNQVTWKCYNAVPFIVSTDPDTGAPSVFLDTTFIVDASIVAAKIATVDAGSITATGNILGVTIEGTTIIGNSTITGATIRTSAINPKVEMDVNGIRAYDSGGNAYFYLSKDNGLTVTYGSGASTAGITSAGTVRFYAGSATPSAAPFRVDQSGALVATNATVTGNITATSGVIGGFSLGATSLTAGSGATTVGMDSGGSNPAFYAGSATPGSAPYRVTAAGALVATNATITGTITGSTITGSTITGSTVVGGTVGARRVVINGTGTNEPGQAVWYDANGTTVLGTIGIVTDAPDTIILDVGSTSLSYAAIRARSSTASAGMFTSVSGIALTASTTSASSAQAAILAQSFSSYSTVPAIIGSSSVGIGVEGVTGGGIGLKGVGNTNGTGVDGSSISGYGGVFTGNSTRSALRITPVSSVPSSAQQGDIICLSTTGKFYGFNGSGWAAMT